jgi:hypothetical protein
VKIVLDLTKPLARRRLLHIPNRYIWIPFKYEKLPRFCFKCGVVKHGRLGCSKVRSCRPNGGEEEYPYGNWLRVSTAARGGEGPYTRFGRYREEQEGEFRPPMSMGAHRFSDDSGYASSDSDGAASDGNPSRNLSLPVLGKSQISRGNLLPEVTPPISGTVMEIKKATNLQEQRKEFVGNAFQYGNMAINDEGQPRVNERNRNG